jgi:hypothetical protein
MSRLKIRIHQYLDGPREQPPQVPVRISAIVKSAKGSATRNPATTAMISVSDLPQDATSVEVKPGHYFVEAVLPSGEILADDISVEHNKESNLVLEAEASAHEWLSWQSFNGNRAAAMPRESATLALLGDGRMPRPMHFKAKAKRKSKSRAMLGRRQARRVHGQGAGGHPGIVQVSIGSPLIIYRNPNLSVGGRSHGSDTWEWLAGLMKRRSSAVTADIDPNYPQTLITPYACDVSNAVYRIKSQDVRTAASERLMEANEIWRTFAGVSRHEAIELISLPIPWTIIESGSEAIVEVGVRQVNSSGLFCSAATVSDGVLGALLGYLSSGSLPTVRGMIERAKNNLYYKTLNPFAAAAGGYALVGTALTAKQEEWHSWIRNLMNLFPAIPDGAIQWAQLKLRARRHKSDLTEAREALKATYDRGIPFFSMGIKWLIEGLEWAAAEDSEAARMLIAVREVARRVNYQQPFTSIRIATRSPESNKQHSHSRRTRAVKHARH